MIHRLAMSRHRRLRARASAISPALSLMITSKGAFLHRRHPCAAEPERGGNRRNRAALAPSMSAASASSRRSRCVSHSDFGTDDAALGAQDARGARADPRKARPTRSRRRNAGRHRAVAGAARLVLPHSRLKGEANMLIMPEPRLRQHRLPDDQDDGRRPARRADPARRRPPAHILTPSVTARGIVNMTAVAVVEAQRKDQEQDMA